MALLDTPLCDFGWQAPDFTLKDANGDAFNMLEMMGGKGLLVAFICNHCPYVVAIAERLAIDAAALKNDDINTIAVMSNDYNDYATDSPENMLKFATHYGFEFPYVIDEDQSVGKTYGAICTPDFFGFNNKGELQYRGRIDSAGMGDATNREPELLNAMRQIAQTGEGPRKQMPSMGCSIKWR